MNLCKDAVELFVRLNAFSEQNGFEYVPEQFLLGALALEEKSPLFGYLKKRGLTKEQIIENVTKFYQKYMEKEEDRWNRFQFYYDYDYNEDEDEELIESWQEEFKSFTFVNTDGFSKSEIIITANVKKILEIADKIARNLYNSASVNNAYLLVGAAEVVPEVYRDFIMQCLGVDVVGSDAYVYDDESVEKFDIPKKLSNFLVLLNDKYSPDEEYCKILGREEETNALIKILAKATKRNAVLVGYPGVGKTAIIEKFVWNIVKGNYAGKLKDTKVLLLDVASIIAGTKYRGTAEARFQELVKFLEKNSNCILFIDEIHTILGAGACNEGELDLANSLKPILARGETRVIGATTFDEYEKYFSKDGALKRRFEKIIVNEPKSDELYDMIKNQILKLEEFHNTKISADLVDFAILNASCFNYETKNPDRTLDLLDRAMAGAELRGATEVSKEDILDNFAIRKKQFERMPKKRKRATAYHEAGHYIVQRFAPELQHYNTLAISIIPAEDYLGVNVFEEDEYATPSENREFYIQMIAKLLAGRRAEKLYTKELSAGANSDLMKATKIAKDMITRYGLDERFTEDRVFLRESENPMYTEKIIEKISEEIDLILIEAKTYADEILREHVNELAILVDELMKHGMLSKTELERIFKSN